MGRYRPRTFPARSILFGTPSSSPLLWLVSPVSWFGVNFGFGRRRATTLAGRRRYNRGRASIGSTWSKRRQRRVQRSSTARFTIYVSSIPILDITVAVGNATLSSWGFIVNWVAVTLTTSRCNYGWETSYWRIWFELRITCYMIIWWIFFHYTNSSILMLPLFVVCQMNIMLLY